MLSAHSSIKTILKKYRSCESGNFALTFGIIAIAMVGIIGAAIDLSSATSVKSEAQARLDAAVLSSVVAGNQNNISVAEIEESGVANFRDHFNPSGKDIQVKSLAISYDEGRNEAFGEAEVLVGTSFMAIFGFKALPLTVKAVAIDGSMLPPVDISIMLDVSGSMDGAKLAGLKDAVTIFMDETIGAGNTSATTRIAFAPFSSSVNAGPFEEDLTGINTIENCVGERSGAHAFTDALPSSDMYSVQGDFAISSDENSGVYREVYFDGYPATSGYDMLNASTLCPEAEIFPLTGNYSQLLAKLDGYNASGITAGHLGIAYAWYLISDEWRDVWPSTSAAASNANTKKVAVLMSDGQFNTYYQSSNGTSNEQSIALCENMKSEGIIIYSVSFDTSGSSEDILKECATAPNYFFNPSTTDELSEAFSDIAGSLAQFNVRLTQ